MTGTAKKSMVVVIRRSPYGSSLARAGVDLALACAAFEQPVELLFQGDGVLHLLSDQEGEAIGLKTVGRVLSSLPLYDIEKVYVDAQALARHHLQEHDLVLPVEALDANGMCQLLATADHLVGC